MAGKAEPQAVANSGKAWQRLEIRNGKRLESDGPMDQKPNHGLSWADEMDSIEVDRIEKSPNEAQLDREPQPEPIESHQAFVGTGVEQMAVPAEVRFLHTIGNADPNSQKDPLDKLMKEETSFRRNTDQREPEQREDNDGGRVVGATKRGGRSGRARGSAVTEAASG